MVTIAGRTYHSLATSSSLVDKIELEKKTLSIIPGCVYVYNKRYTARIGKHNDFSIKKQIHNIETRIMFVIEEPSFKIERYYMSKTLIGVFFSKKNCIIDRLYGFENYS